MKVAVQVKYLQQEDGQLLGSFDAWWDPDFTQRRVAAHLGFFTGKNPPAKVAKQDDWKCTYCKFYHACGGPYLCGGRSQS
jgi:hypothetical protein